MRPQKDPHTIVQLFVPFFCRTAKSQRCSVSKLFLLQLLLSIQYVTDGSIQLIVVDPGGQAETLRRNPLRQSWLHAD